jgi:hypothetical protein
MQKVEQVASQMEEGKALGPDGFIINLFHHYWYILKHEVWDLVK